MNRSSREGGVDFRAFGILTLDLHGRFQGPSHRSPKEPSLKNMFSKKGSAGLKSLEMETPSLEAQKIT